MVSPSSFDAYNPDDAVANLTGFPRIWYKCKEQPLVPIGVLATTYALTRSAMAIRQGNSKQANRFFGARVLFQGFTICVLVAGSYAMAAGDGKTKAELEAEKAARRKQLWLEELERQGAVYKKGK
ncbi:hypoxia induced protein conserved region-domain-containing protein [Lipomyces oligophaga]|uniref:hypoxia induced protein conserved region-domain-containing protein n=1 Tax=Lipomyces oligophaga TaxID=45792 RepID=UPI0034CE3D81